MSVVRRSIAEAVIAGPLSRRVLRPSGKGTHINGVMLLRPSQIDRVYRIVDNEPSPGSGFLAAFDSIFNTLTGELWARRVSHVIVGGDALTAAAHANRIIRHGCFKTPPQVAIVRDQRSEISPLAALEDADFLASMIDDKALPAACRQALDYNAADRSSAVAKIVGRQLAGALRSSGARLRITEGSVRADGVAGGEILACVQHLSPSQPSSVERVPPPLDPGAHELRTRSERARAIAWVSLLGEIADMAEPIGNRGAYANVLVAKEITILSGSISPKAPSAEDGEDAALGPASDALGANLSLLSQGIPQRVQDALLAWKHDLIFAQHRGLVEEV